MYRITLNGHLIHDPRVNDLQVIAPKLTLEANKIGSLSFGMHEAHEFYNRAEKLSSIVAVYRDSAQNPIFMGRVLSSATAMNGTVTYQCEELSAYLLDSVFRPFSYQGGLQDFFEQVLAAHNAQVESYKRIHPGTVTVTDSNDYIARSSVEYLSCWEVLTSRLVDTHGGFLIPRYEPDGMYLDYLSADPASLDTATQAIEFGENMIDLALDVSADETYTVCIPLGAKLSEIGQTEEGEPAESGEEQESTSEERLTIESVNGGLDYLVNEEARAKYGWIVAPVSETTWDDVTLPENLLSKGLEYLNSAGVKFRQTLTLTALDLHNADADIERFNFLDFIEVRSARHKVSATYILKRIELPLDDPTGAKITLGDECLTLTDTLLKERLNAAEQIRAVQSAASSARSHADAVSDLLAQTEETLSSLIGQTEAQIITQIARDYVAQSAFQTYKESVSTRFTQTENAFEFRFSSTSDLISALDGDVKRKFESYDKYIRLDSGKIILGEAGKPLTLVIENERISFRLNNNEIAYFTSDRLYVNNLEALSTLTLGNFAFFPRPGNRNLSFKRLRGLGAE